MYLKISEFYATCNNLISKTINTTHLVISEDRKLLHTFKSHFLLSQYVNFLSGYILPIFLVLLCISKERVSTLPGSVSLNMSKILTQTFHYS